MARTKSDSAIVPWVQATMASAYASGIALGLMFWARQALQIRTLPERLMEAVLRVVPPAQFEASIERFGPAGKDYALYATTAGVFLALVIVGMLALRFTRRPAGLLALGLLLYLLAMAVIAPLTGAGPFATGLFVNPLLSNAISLGAVMAYVSVLLCAQLISRVWPSVKNALPAEAGISAGRRALFTSLAVSAASFVVTLVTGRSSGRIVSGLPVASAPTAAAPAPSPTAVATPWPAIAALTTQAPTVTPAASPTIAPRSAALQPVAPTSTPGYPEAPPERQLPRDKDGALLAVKREKGQLQTLVQRNSDFYVVTKNAAGDPVLSTRDWRLIVDGAVNRPVQLDYPTLRGLPAVQVAKTLECISNLTAKCELTSFGCDLISTAQWTGVRLTDVLALAGGVKPGVVTIAAISADEYSSALPAAAATDPEVLLVYEMNGEVLPREHGFPVRLLTPDRYGLKNAKWLVNLRPMTQPYMDWWGQRNWSQTAVVKTMSRIDVPVAGARLQAGAQRISGIAYAGTRGIANVEFSSDGGKTWHAATLTPGPGKDTFVQWAGIFPVTVGQSATLVSRATDGQGNLQIEQFSLPQPNGGMGWDSITLEAVS